MFFSVAYKESLMTIMIIGLVQILGMHRIRIYADDWRRAQIAKRGEATW